MQHDYEKMVHEALNEPGKIAACYSAFWSYSMGNQILAMWQLGRAEPISTFPGWLKLGRHVKKGEKAIQLLMPIFKKAAGEVASRTEPEERNAVYFISRRNWFGLHQTEGAEFVPVIPGFDLDRALVGLNIKVEQFSAIDGNCQGYAKTDERTIAINPVAFDKIKTSFHEAAHVLLHPHKTSAHAETRIPKDACEVEAELTAYLTKSALGQTGNLEYSRGYIQHWISDGTVEKVRFNKVFMAVDEILKAGRVLPEPEPERPTPTASLAASHTVQP